MTNPVEVPPYCQTDWPIKSQQKHAVLKRRWPTLEGKMKGLCQEFIAGEEF